MKKIIFLVVIVSALIALSGCPQLPDLFPEDLSNFKDCTGDDACIRSAIRNCEQAYSIEDEGDESMTMKMKFVIYGLEQDKCKMKFTVEEVETNPTNEEEAAMAGWLVQLLEGQEMTCMVPAEKLESIEAVETEAMLEYCSGFLIDAMKTLQGMQG